MRQALTANTAADEAVSVSARPSFLALTLGCIGVVYGDIGTSPLYALRESVLAATNGGHAATEPVILGILSLIIWALILIVTVKYVLILLRADNDGEGGTLALMALANRALGLVIILRHCQRRTVLRRRSDHAGNLCAVGGGRTFRRYASPPNLRRPPYL